VDERTGEVSDKIKEKITRTGKTELSPVLKTSAPPVGRTSWCGSGRKPCGLFPSAIRLKIPECAFEEISQAPI